MRIKVHPWVVDVALTAALLAATLYEGHAIPAGWRPFDAEAYVLSIAAVLPLMTRRRAPTWSLVVSGGCWLAYILAGYWPVANAYAYLLLLYTVAALRPLRYAAGGVALGVAVWGIGGSLIGGLNPAGVLAQGLIVQATVCWAGFGAKQLAERNRQLAQATAELARRAVTGERMRIARELHDVVAHHLSVISIQAGLAKYVYRSDPETAGTALTTIESLIADTLREMRRMLTLLRVEATEPGRNEDAYHPAPALADLPTLFERIRAAGVDLEVTVTGTPRQLLPGVELCAYRVVQESMTNVLKHAAPTSARVALDYGQTTFTVRVTDDGRAEPPARRTAGQGLIGMRERALIYGGTLEAGPRHPRGYAVRLVLPTAEARQRGSEEPP